MSLIIRSDFNGVTDPDAGAYIAAVENADAQPLEFAVGKAINDFVVGCKRDGIWNAIKASCILAGARTLNGALVPLVGTAPTNVGNNFTSSNYNRKTGLQGNAANARLDSNRNNNLDPQNSKHVAAYVRALPTTVIGPNYPRLIFAGDGSGNDTLLAIADNISVLVAVNSGFDIISTGALSSGLFGLSRSGSNSYICRLNGSNATVAKTSGVPRNANHLLFSDASNAVQANARLAFYSIGESLDLALLDARVTALINAFGAAIP